MKDKKIIKSIVVLAAGAILLGAGPKSADFEESEPVPCQEYFTDGSEMDIAFCSERTATGFSAGNHELDCTVIRPWNLKNRAKAKMPKGGYPVIIWANGWGWNNVEGETTTDGYKPGLIKWALTGPYIVVAANQWSVQESDLLGYVQWIVDQNTNPDSDYYKKINTDKIGLAGHSQGGGAVIKAGGDGSGMGLPITATIAMNPYGPAWVNPGFQDGPMLILGGENDTTTPPESYFEVWEDVSTNGIGGINATLQACTHNSEAWGVFPYPDGTTMSNEEARTVNFVKYQAVTQLWWDYFLNDEDGSLNALVDMLEGDHWMTEFACTPDFLPCED